MGPLRVIIINEVDGARRNLKNMLTRHGFIIVAEVKDAAAGLRVLSTTETELIITEDATAGWQDVARFVVERHDAPILLIVSLDDSSIAEEAADLGIAGLIVRPLTERNLALLARFTAVARMTKYSRRLRPVWIQEGLAVKSRRELFDEKINRLAMKKDLP